MPDFVELDLTGLNVDHVTLRRAILTADYGHGYKDTTRVGPLGGTRQFTLTAGVWPDDEDIATIDGVSWMEYYTTFFDERLDNANEPFVIDWRDRKWLVDLAEPQYGVEVHTSDLFTPDGITLNLRRIPGIEFNDDGSLTGPDVPTGLTLDYLTSTSITASWDGPPDVEAPTAPVLTSAVADSPTEVTMIWTAATDNVGVTGYQTRLDGGAWTDRGLVLTYQYTGLSASTEYDFEVRAYDAAGNFSAASNLISETTDPGALLDTLGLTAAVACGLRKLRSAYGGSCLRLRRASDDVEQDIGFDGNDMDWAAAIAFKAASTVSVVTWYDQSGNGKNLTAVADPTREPILDTSTEVVDFDGSNDLMRTTSTVDLSGTDAVSVFLAGKADALAVQNFVTIYDGSGANVAAIRDDGALCVASQTVGGSSNNKYGSTDTTARVYAAVFDRSQAGASDTKFYWDGVEQTNTGDTTNVSGNFSATSSARLAEENGASIANMKAYELIVFPIAVDDTDRGVAETNMATYYGL